MGGGHLSGPLRAESFQRRNWSRESRSEDGHALLIREVSTASLYWSSPADCARAPSLPPLLCFPSYCPFPFQFELPPWLLSLPGWEEVAALFADPSGLERWSSLSCYPFLIRSHIINFFFFLSTRKLPSNTIRAPRALRKARLLTTVVNVFQRFQHQEQQRSLICALGRINQTSIHSCAALWEWPGPNKRCCVFICSAWEWLLLQPVSQEKFAMGLRASARHPCRRGVTAKLSTELVVLNPGLWK